MAFPWQADDGPTLNAGLLALWFSRGTGPVLLGKPIALLFCRGLGSDSHFSTLHPHLFWIGAWYECFNQCALAAMCLMFFVYFSRCCRFFDALWFRHVICGSIGGQGVRTPPPLENYKMIGFLSNTGPDPLKITKLPSQHSMLGQHRPASETPFKWCFAGGPLIAR